jgi:hypothetical protein
MTALKVWDREGREHDFSGVWAKQAVFLLVNGPSLNDQPLELLDRPGIVTAGVNNGWFIRRPNLWFCCDDPGNFADTGWKDPTIMKFCPRDNLDKKMLVKLGPKKWKESIYTVGRMPNVWGYERYLGFNASTFFEGPQVNWGCNGQDTCSEGYKSGRSVMLVAMRILVWMGFRRIYIAGADFKMKEEQPYAFNQMKYGNGVNHNNRTYTALNARLAALRPGLEQRKVTVTNVTKGGNLEAFDRGDFEECVEQESKTCGKEVDPADWYMGRQKKKIVKGGRRRKAGV